MERAPNFEHAGYMIGLYPLGSRVLHGLGLYDRLLAESGELRTYDLHDGHGRRLQHFDWTPLNERYGSFRLLTRPRLLGVLSEALARDSVSMDVEPQALEQTPTRCSSPRATAPPKHSTW
jgi:2-polyprenyl-6-methoxyphenol hydroxylase-like FAD-dependent oxidoreductase